MRNCYVDQIVRSPLTSGSVTPELHIVWVFG
jgi:hypothetical protein